jgi:hypothetical protein
VTSLLRWVIWVSLWFTALLAQGALAAPNPFDGRWSVVLVCPDTTDKSGLVKGYEYTFAISIREGAVQGEYGAPGHPASVFYAGQVSDDGTLEIKATGNTGRSEYSVGKVAQGTRYGYTMQGKLVGSGGQATRKELRPCTATFARS